MPKPPFPTAFRHVKAGSVPGTVAAVALAAVILALPTMQGCTAGKASAVAAVTAEDLVDRRLREAGESITKDMAILAGSTQNRDEGQPQVPGDLGMRVDLVYEGAIEGAVERLCAMIGWQFVVEGRKKDRVPLIVHVKQKDRPALAVFREIGLQTGPRHGLEIDESIGIAKLVLVPEKASKMEPQVSPKPIGGFRAGGGRS
jgi:hypothetical protein